MLRSYHHWNSPALGRTMELLVFGQGGARVLAFPTCEGRFFDWENHGMVEAVGEYVDLGLLQLFCLDSIDSEAWFAMHLHPAERAHRHAQYDTYLRHEVEPFSRRLNPNPVLITAGTGFGAYHALNFAFRYPQLVGRVLSLSGVWDLKSLTSGYYDDTIYFHNPIDFVLNEHDPGRLAALRRMDIIFAVGAEEDLRPNVEFLSGELWRKGIGNALRVWQGSGHDWHTWGQMLPKYIGGYD